MWSHITAREARKCSPEVRSDRRDEVLEGSECSLHNSSLQIFKGLKVNEGQNFSVLLQRGGRNREADVGSMNGRTSLTILT